MAQAGYTPIRLYYSTTASAVPTAGNLEPGELALNIADMKLYCENSSGVVTLLASSGGASGDVVGPASSTANAVPTFSGTTGKIIQNNSSVTISAGVVTANGFSGPLNGTVGATSPSTGVFTDVTLNAQGDVRFADSDSSNWVAFQGAATITSNVTWTLPSVDGTSGQVLATNGSGTLSWASAGDLPIGTLTYFAGTTTTAYPGTSWLFCDGSSVSQSTYATLFSRIGFLFNSASNTWNVIYGTSAGATSGGEYSYNNFFDGSFQFISTSPGSNSWQYTSTNGAPGWTFRSNLSGGLSSQYAYMPTWNGSTAYVVGSAYGFHTSTNNTNWTYVNFNPSGLSDFTDGVYADGRFLYGHNSQGGGQGITTVVTSTNGTNWASSTFTSLGDDVYGVTYGDKYVIGTGRGKIFTSTNAGNNAWTERTSPTSDFILTLRYLNGLYIYAGSSGALGTSTDGITWTSRTSGTASSILSLTYGSGVYVYSDTGGAVGTSTNAINWTRSTGVFTHIYNSRLAFGNSTFVLQYNGPYNLTSTNASNWSAGGITFTTSTFYSSLYVESTGVNLFGGDGGVLRYATDASNLQTVTPNTGNSIRALSYGAFYLLASSAGEIETSTNGINWTARTSGTTSQINSFAYNGSVYVYVGSSVCASSTNAINWTARTQPNVNNWLSVTYGAGNFVAVGESGGIYTSTNGVTWQTQSSTTASALWSIYYSDAQKKFVVSGTGTMLVSYDGTTWARVSPGTTSSIFGVTYAYSPRMDPNSGYWAAAGGAGYLATATDGVNWTTRTSGTTNTMRSIAYGTGSPGTIVAAGFGGRMFSLAPYSYNTTSEFGLPIENTDRSSESTVKQNLYIKAL